MENIIKKIFKYETMDGNGACPMYLERWELLRLFKCRFYLHHFKGDDWTLDPHDHPRRFISIGLKGWYYEDSFKDGFKFTKKYSAPWIRTFPPEHLHLIRAKEHGNVWTLVIVLPIVRQWGFVRDGEWIVWHEYVFGNKSRKSC